MEQIMDEKFVTKVFLDNIHPIHDACDHDYVMIPFMDMVHMLIKK